MGNNIVQISKKIVNVYVILLFVFIWISYYNNFAFGTFRELGGAISVLIYFVLYQGFANLFKGFKIGTYSIIEICFSQAVAIILSNAILYIECCLIANKYIPIIPMIITYGVQLVGVLLWAVVAKQYFIHNIASKSTLIIYGSEDVDVYTRKMDYKYKHLFRIDTCLSCEIPDESLYGSIDEHEVIMLYEITEGYRTKIMKYCIRSGKEVYMTPRIGDITVQGFGNHYLIDTPLLKYEYHYHNTEFLIRKRMLDVVVAVVGLIIGSFPMLLTAIAIKIEDGGPILFRQKRYTKDGAIFSIMKFRSMIVDAEADGKPKPCTEGDVRITKVGAIIRKYRIDELPQLFNVLKGEMSIVGPRPERVEHVEQYTRDLPEFSYRLNVKAGLTGYAQIYGKYNTTSYDKLKLDLMYIENQTIFLDMQLMLLTLRIIWAQDSTEGFQLGEANDTPESTDKRENHN